MFGRTALLSALTTTAFGQGVITFEDLVGSEGLQVTNQYNNIGGDPQFDRNIVFGMVGVWDNASGAACHKRGNAVDGCRVWFENPAANAANINDDAFTNANERPLLVEVGPATGENPSGFYGGNPSKWCDLRNGGTPLDGVVSGNGVASDNGNYWQEVCDRCCSTCAVDFDTATFANGGFSCVKNMDDWVEPVQGASGTKNGFKFLTDSAGLSKPNTIKIFAVAYTNGVGSNELGGSILDVDCNGNWPNRLAGGLDAADPQQDPTLCEAWLVRGWASAADADQFFSNPDVEANHRLQLDTAFVSAVEPSTIHNPALGRYVEACDASRTGGACGRNAQGEFIINASCCPTSNMGNAPCGIRNRPWCYLTPSFKHVAGNTESVPVNSGAADSRSSEFGLKAGANFNFLTIEWAGTKVGQTLGLAFDNFSVDSVLTTSPTEAFTEGPTEEMTGVPTTTPGPTTASGSGDPHFYDFAGGRFDVMGEPDKIYNIISDVDFQLNARFVAGSTAHNTTFIGEMGAVIGEHTIKFNPSTCDVVIDDDVSLPNAFGEFSVGAAKLTMESSSISFNVPHFHIGLGCFAKRQAAHFNLNVGYQADEEAKRLPHGILGQTTDMQPRERHGKQGEGAIEGTYEDYEVSSLFGSDFTYNRFEYGYPQRRLLNAEYKRAGAAF